MTANVFLILHLVFLPSFLDAAPWLFSLLCHFASLFLDPLLTDVFRAMATKAMGFLLLFSDTLYVILAEGVLSCICFFLVVITPLLWGL